MFRHCHNDPVHDNQPTHVSYSMDYVKPMVVGPAMHVGHMYYDKP
jgi:hypothetical protein